MVLEVCRYFRVNNLWMYKTSSLFAKFWPWRAFRQNTLFQNFLLTAVSYLFASAKTEVKVSGSDSTERIPERVGCISLEIYHFNSIPLMYFKLTTPLIVVCHVIVIMLDTLFTKQIFTMYLMNSLWTKYCGFFALLGSEARSRARFGRGRGSIFLDNVGCNGTELRLTNCTNRGIGVHRCSHFEDAAVVCSGIQYNVLKAMCTIYIKSLVKWCCKRFIVHGFWFYCEKHGLTR